MLRETDGTVWDNGYTHACEYITGNGRCVNGSFNIRTRQGGSGRLTGWVTSARTDATMTGIAGIACTQGMGM
eukprot:5887614-Prymnesium_polylepis.1